MTQYVSCTAMGQAIPIEACDVILSIHGPKGGTRTIEGLSLEQAKSLRNELNMAIKALELRP